MEQIEKEQEESVTFDIYSQKYGRRDTPKLIIKETKKIQAKVLKFNFENISLRWYIRREYVELKNKEKVEILGRKR